MIKGLFGYTVQICGLLHDHATLMATGGQCAQSPMQIDHILNKALKLTGIDLGSLHTVNMFAQDAVKAGFKP